MASDTDTPVVLATCTIDPTNSPEPSWSNLQKAYKQKPDIDPADNPPGSAVRQIEFVIKPQGTVTLQVSGPGAALFSSTSVSASLQGGSDVKVYLPLENDLDAMKSSEPYHFTISLKYSEDSCCDPEMYVGPEG